MYKKYAKFEFSGIFLAFSCWIEILEKVAPLAKNEKLCQLSIIWDSSRVYQ